MSPLKTCRLCCKTTVRSLIQIDAHPISHRYATSTQPDVLHPIHWGLCSTCGTFQIDTAIPAVSLSPVHDWISYVEPEAHLDQLADIIQQELGHISRDPSTHGVRGDDCMSLGSNALIFGATYKDDSLLNRLQQRGYSNVHRLDPHTDLGINRSTPHGFEAIQSTWSQGRMNELAARFGRPDLLIVRHLFEHTYESNAFLVALRQWVAPNGWLISEVPDSERAYRERDVTVLWEEHTIYLTPATLARGLSAAGWHVHDVMRFPYRLEDCLVGVAQNTNPAVIASGNAVAAELQLVEDFAASVEPLKDKLHQWLTNQREQGHRLAMLGAGHRASTFLKLFEVSPHLDCVFDDDPHKQNLRMPGTRLMIEPTSAIPERGIGVCLIAVNPDIEDRLIERHAAFRDPNLRLISIFPSSPRSIFFQL